MFIVYNIKVMKKVIYINSVATMLCLLLLLTTATASQVDMQQLPAYDTYSCTICHTSEEYIDDLNQFGVDYQSYGAWDSYLAGLDSDGDGCTNGFELGDSDGNGELDFGNDAETGNPGAAGDCAAGSVVDEATWGSLKALFSSHR
jgi:hypothetical protein